MLTPTQRGAVDAIVREELRAEARLPRHPAPSEITLLGVSGLMNLLLDDRTVRKWIGRRPGFVVKELELGTPTLIRPGVWPCGRFLLTKRRLLTNKLLHGQARAVNPKPTEA